VVTSIPRRVFSCAPLADRKYVGFFKRVRDTAFSPPRLQDRIYSPLVFARPGRKRAIVGVLEARRGLIALACPRFSAPSPRHRDSPQRQQHQGREPLIDGEEASTTKHVVYARV